MDRNVWKTGFYGIREREGETKRWREKRREREGERKKHPGEGKSWDYENIARKTARVNKVGLPSNGAMMCFPLCAQLVYETVSNTSPLVSQTLTQAGEFNFSLLGGSRNSHVENFKTL